MKEDLIRELDIVLKEELKITLRAAKSAHDAATHEDSKPENKYDTKGLEASYLAGAQTRRANEIQAQIDELELLQIVNFKEHDNIRLSCLIEIENEDGQTSLLLLLPSQGGFELKHSGQTIKTITPLSPIGKKLIGKQIGDEIELEVHGKKSYLNITNIK